MKKVTLKKIRNEMWEIQGQVLYWKQKRLDDEEYGYRLTE